MCRWETFLCACGLTMVSLLSAAASDIQFSVKSLDGKPVDLAKQYQGQVLLIVNVASKCGLTPQYEGLEALYGKYGDKGLRVLAFPCNQFGQQEPGTDSQIKEFCDLNYSVTFPLFSKISVKGEDIHPLYAYLTSEQTDPGYAGEISWNFTKFLLDRKGRVIDRFQPKTTPDDPLVMQRIEQALAAK